MIKNAAGYLHQALTSFIIMVHSNQVCHLQFAYIYVGTNTTQHEIVYQLRHTKLCDNHPRLPLCYIEIIKTLFWGGGGGGGGGG